MHPILASRRRLSLYFLSWIPLAAMLSAVLWAAGGNSIWEASAEVGPACFVYAFVCLSPWYICRARPLRLSAAPGLLATFLSAASASGLILAGGGRFMAALLGRPFPQWPALLAMGVLLYMVSVALHYAVLAVAASHESERREAEARTLAREAELLALRIQLNPHFLFNSLHSVSALAVADGVRARDMCLRLADFLRSSLGLGKRETVSLREELALARSYLEVERVRFGSRLRVEEQIQEECLECAIPALLLQPLVENAVKHGISGLVEGGTIHLTARRVDGDIAIRIENGFDPESGAPRSLGIGQQHVRRRLAVRYGSAASLEAGAVGGTYFADLRLPCESPIASSSLA